MVRISTDLLLSNLEIVAVAGATHPGIPSIIKRWRDEGKYFLDLTGKRPRKSVIFTKDGYCIVTHYSVARLESKLIKPSVNDSQDQEDQDT